jgi:hypothetical protein
VLEALLAELRVEPLDVPLDRRALDREAEMGDRPIEDLLDGFGRAVEERPQCEVSPFFRPRM